MSDREKTSQNDWTFRGAPAAGLLDPPANHVSPRALLFKSADEARAGQSHQHRRRPARQIRAAEIDFLVDRYRAVRNIRQVAREFGISRTTAAQHLTDRGVDTSHGMSGADKDEVVRLYSQGLSSARIGQQLGFDNHTILNAVRSADLSVRPPIAAPPCAPGR